MDAWHIFPFFFLPHLEWVEWVGGGGGCADGTDSGGDSMRKIGTQCPGAQGVGFGAVLVLRMAKRMSAGVLGLGCRRGCGCGHAQAWHGCTGLNCGAGEPAEAHILAWIVLKIMGDSRLRMQVMYIM